jgi:lysozyme
MASLGGLGGAMRGAIAGSAAGGASAGAGSAASARPAAYGADHGAGFLSVMAAEGEVGPADPSKVVPGIDVSHWQGTINWDEVAASGMKYAFIRVSDGTGTLDTEFDRNWSESARVGMLRGAYQYFRPNQDPIAQAKIMVEKVGQLGPNDLPPVLDLESGGNEGIPAERIVAAAMEWAKYVEEHTGKRPIIYAGHYYWEGEVQASDAFADYLLWVPNYSREWPLVPDPWQSWAFFQHTSEGRVPGIAGNVDMNYFNGDEGALSRIAKAGAVTLQAVTEGDLSRARQSLEMLLGLKRRRTFADRTRHTRSFASGTSQLGANTRTIDTSGIQFTHSSASPRPAATVLESRPASSSAAAPFTGPATNPAAAELAAGSAPAPVIAPETIADQGAIRVDGLRALDANELASLRASAATAAGVSLAE